MQYPPDPWGLRRKVAGFTLIELLISIAIIGMIAAMLVPSLLEALHKGRQKRTMGDLRSLGLAVMLWRTDVAGAGAAGASGISTFDFGAYQPTTPESLANLLVPDYVASIPETDAWGTPVRYASSCTLSGATADCSGAAGLPFFLAAASAGADGVFEGTEYTPGIFAPTDYGQDIVMADGTFIRSPDPASSSAGS